MNEEITSEKEASTLKMASYNVTFYFEIIIMYSYNVLIFFFYEVVVGLPILLVGLSFIIYAIWNMINDPLAGYLTDKPTKWADKWGVRKPWILLGAIGTVIFWFLLFAPPDLDVKSDPWPTFWYMVIITCILDAFYSIFTTHNKGGFPNQFRSDNERRKSSVISRLIQATAPLTCGAILIPRIINYEDISSFLLYGLVTSIILCICIILFYPGIKESPIVIARYMEGHEARENLSFWNVIKGAFKSKYFILNLFAIAMYSIASSLMIANLIYFVKDVLNLDIQYFAILTLTWFIALYISIPIWNKIAKKVGPIKVVSYGFVLVGIAFLNFLWVSSLLTAMFAMAMCAFLFGSWLSMYMVMMSDSYDSVTAELGCHQEATLYGIMMFFVRVTFLVIGAILTIVHISTGYNPDPNATQTPLAIMGIRLISGLFPAIFAIAGGIALILWYDLVGDKRAAMKAKLKECGL